VILYRISLLTNSWDKSGLEAARLGGRWNSKGRPAIYASTSLSLALLELYVRFGGLHSQDNWVVTEFELPIDIALESWSAEELPIGWNMPQFPHVAQHLGDRFLESNQHVGVMVPSVLIPQERHVMLNPAHPDMKEIHIIGVEEMGKDLRITRY
jgi:RES domain-containing protein